MSFNKISLLTFLLLTNAHAAMPEVSTTNLLIATVSLFLLILVFRLTKKPKKRELVDILDANETEPADTHDEFEVGEVIDDPYASEAVEEELAEVVTQTVPETQEVSDAEAFAQSVEEEPVVEVEEVYAPEPTPPAQSVSRIKRPRDTNHDKIHKGDFVKFAGMNVLVAEDNIINQKVIKGLLAESQMNIVMADDGQFTLDILAENSDFSVILMDAHMPRVDGFEATRAIRANSAYDHIAVIALSGDTAADDIRNMSEAGMEQHLEKPLKMDHLFEILSMYLPDEEEEIEQEEDVVEAPVVASSGSVLNRVAGLDVCGGDEGLYQELINDFIEAYGESDVEIQGHIAKDDFDSVARMLLDIKGISAQIGSNELALCADELRNAVIAKDFGLISTLEQNYHRTLHDLLLALK